MVRSIDKKEVSLYLFPRGAIPISGAKKNIYQLSMKFHIFLVCVCLCVVEGMWTLWG